jgi:hypothetical protein
MHRIIWLPTSRTYYRASTSLARNYIPKRSILSSPWGIAITNLKSESSTLHVNPLIMATRRLRSTDATRPKTAEHTRAHEHPHEHDHDQHSHSHSILGSFTHSHSHGEDGHAHGVGALDSTGVYAVFCTVYNYSRAVLIWEARRQRNADYSHWPRFEYRFDDFQGVGWMVYGA